MAITMTKTPYQQNLQQEQPAQQNPNKWYAGEQPTTREIYGRIGEVYKQNKFAGNLFANQFMKLQQTQGSPYYNAYTAPTNNAVKNLQAYGFDTSALNDDWFNKNTEWQNYLRISDTTNGVLAPTKKASEQELIAYNLYQYQKSEADTKQAETEWAALKQELAYKAGQKDRNYSDDDIINSIDWSKYSKLAKMRSTMGASPIELNRAIDFSDDAMRGVLWAARNDGGTGNTMTDIVLSAMGEGNQWKDNPELRAKLNWNDKSTYAPYSVGATLDEDVGMYFGKYDYTQSDIDNLRKTIDPNDATAVKNFQKLADAYNDTQIAREQRNNLQGQVDRWLQYGNYDADTIIKMMDNLLEKGDYSMLKKMDDSINNGSSLVQFTGAVKYSHGEMEKYIRERKAKQDKVKNGALLQRFLREQASGNNRPGTTAQPTQPEAGQPATEESAEPDAVSGTSVSAPVFGRQKIYSIENPGAVQQTDNSLYTGDFAEEQYANQPVPGTDFTDADIEAGIAKDKASGEAAAVVDDITTDDVKAGWAGSGSSFYDSSKSFFAQIADNIKYRNTAMTNAMQGGLNTYVETALDTCYDIYHYDEVNEQYEADKKTYDELKLKYGDAIYLEKTFQPTQEVKLDDGSTAYLTWDESNKKYVVDSVKSDELDQLGGWNYFIGSESDFNINEYQQHEELKKQLQEKADKAANEATIETQRIESAQTKIGYEKDFARKRYGEDGVKAVEQEIEEYKNLDIRMQKEQEYLSANEEDYLSKQQTLGMTTMGLQMITKVMEWAGMDVSAISEADAILADISTYYDEPQLPGKEYSELQSYDMMVGDQATPESRSAYVAEGIQKTQDAIDTLQMEMDYIDEKGFNVPFRIRQNMKWKMEDLQNKLKSFEYSQILTDTPKDELDEAIEAGKAFEKYVYDNVKTVNVADMSHILANGFEGYENLVTEDEKQIYYYLLGKAAMENGGEYTDLVDKFRETLDTEVREEAHGVLDALLKTSSDYFDFLNNDDYGVWTIREANQIAEQAQEEVDAGTGSGVWANAKSTLLTPLESLESIYYTLDRQLNNKRINSKSGYRNFTAYKENVRAATRQSIEDTYGKGTVASYLANLGYEIYCNRGDSMMNALAFGNLFHFGGKFGNMLNELAGASPMGSTAALTAAANAIDNGANMDEAWFIAGVTFLSETATEAITFSNIKEALGTTGELSKETLKQFCLDWLKKDGVEEAIGESINDLAENWADEYAAKMKNSNYNSEHQQLVDKYRASGYGPDEAEARARDEEARGVLRTAFVSYLSAGMDVGVKAVKAGASTTNYYRKVTRFNQQMGNSDSMLGTMLKEYREKKGIFAPQESAKPAQTAPAEQNTVKAEEQTDKQNLMSEKTATAKENAAQREAETEAKAKAEDKKLQLDEKKQEALQRAGEKKANKKSVTEDQKKTASDVAVIEQAKDADASTQNAAMSTALTTSSKNGTDFVADAAAAHVTRVLGDGGSTIIQQTLVGAAEAGMNTRNVKTAIKNAMLGDGAATAVMQSEAFQNATPAEKARMLIETIPLDANNKNVQRNVNSRTLDFRRGRVYSTLAQTGHFDQAKADQVAAEKAVAVTKQAQENLSNQQQVEQQAVDEVQRTSEEATNNPTPDNVEQNNKATANLNHQVIVTDQQQQALDKAQQDQKNAEDKANKSKQDAMNTAKDVADQQIAQEDEAIAQQEEADRIAEEQIIQQEAEANRQQMLEDQRSGKLEEESVEAKIRRLGEKNGLTGEQLDKYVRDLTEFQKNKKLGKIDMSKQFSKSEGMLVMGALSRRFNVNVVFDSNMKDGDNGFYNPSTNTITLNGKLPAGQVMVEFALHELTHSLESSKNYGKYHDTVLNVLYPSSAELNEAVAKKMSDYEEAGHPINEEQAKRELVAEFTRTRLNNKDMVWRMVDAGFGGKIRTALHNINQFLKNLKLSGKDRETAENLRRAERMFINALNAKKSEQASAQSNNETIAYPNGPVNLTDWSNNRDVSISGVSFADDNTYYVTTDGERIPATNFDGGTNSNDANPANKAFSDWWVKEAEKKYNKDEFSSVAGELTDAQKAQAIAEANTDYMSAVERGDMKAAQEDVDFAAGQAGYTENAYHGTDRFGFTMFDLYRGEGTIFVSYSPVLASTYTNNGEVRNIGIPGQKRLEKMTTDEMASEIARMYADPNTGSPRYIVKHISNEEATQIALDKIRNKADSLGYVDDLVTDAFNVLLSRGTELSQDDLFQVYDVINAHTINIKNAHMMELFNALELLDYANNNEDIYSMEGTTSYGGYEKQNVSYTTRTETIDSQIKYGQGKINRNGIYQLYTKPGNQLIVDANGSTWASIPWTSVIGELTDENEDVWEEFDENYYKGRSKATTREIAEWAKEHGYDSVRINNVHDYGGRNGNKEAGFGDIGIFFAQDDVKSADTVTYDDNGNIIPLDQRFTDNPDIRYHVGNHEMTVAELDQAYNEAVNSGDTKTAQQMVDEVAKQKMDKSVVRDKDGNLLLVYHGTNADFNEFRRDMIGSTGRFEGSGFNFTPYEGRASSYGKNVLAGYLNIQKPLSAEKKTISVSELAALIRRADPTGDNIIADYAKETRDYGKDSFVRRESMTAARNVWDYSDNDVDIYSFISAADSDAEGLIAEFEKLGHDGLIHYDDNGEIKTAVAFNSEQFKSTSPVTYDDNGNVIPLSERFNLENPDIRYSAGESELTDAERMQALAEAGAITQEELDAYNAIGETERPLEGQHPEMSTAQGPNVRAFADLEGMLHNSDEISEFAKAVVMAQNTYFPDTNADQVQRAINWIRSLKETPNSDGYAEALQAVTSDNFDYRSADGQARMVAVMGLANAKNDVMAQVALNDAFSRQGTDIGRMMQARKLYLLMTPSGRIHSLQNMMKAQQEKLNAKNIDVTLKFSDWIYKAASVAENEDDFRKVQMAAAAELAEQLPANWKDRLNTIRMLSMLANPRTHFRNFIGNAMFIPAVSLKNKLGAIAELGMKQGDRTKTLGLVSKEIRDFASEDAVAMKPTLTGEAKFNEGTIIKQNQAPLGQFVKTLSDLNGNALEAEDWFFLKGHYRRALSGWIQANGYTVEQLKSDQKLLEQGRAYAINEAQKATYRDFNKLAQSLNKISQDGGLTGFVVDAVLPFKKTPANILRRGIEYSPVGLAKGLWSLATKMKSGQMTPNQVVDQICSGLSGSIICTIGYLLAGSGAISCGLDDDDDKFEKAKGAQEYAVKANLFGQDVTFTLDWAAPISMPLFVGAAIRNMDTSGEVNVDKVINAFGNITEPVFNLSMLDGINTLFKTSQYDDTNTITQIAAKVGTNYLSSYVPSIFGAIARTIDDKQRKSFVKQGEGTGVLGTARYTHEQVQNKIPFYNQQNIAVRDIWGNEKTSSLAERILENFILPGYVNNYTEDPIINEMGRLYDATGDSAMIPKEDPDKSITVNKEKRVLTDKQWDLYKATRNQTAFKELTELINSSTYKTATDAAQVEMIKKIWNHADQVGRKAVFSDYDVKETNVSEIATSGKVSTYKNELVKALKADDYMAYETMAKALADENVPGQEIKEKIATAFRDEWKKAYKKGDIATMNDIEEQLRYTGYEFNIYGKGGWRSQVDGN